MKRGACICFFLAGLLGAQDGTYTLHGRVIDAANSAPLSGARVTVSAFSNPTADGRTPSETSVLTDASGSFSIVGVPPGYYSLSAKRSGYGQGSEPIPPITVDAAKGVEPVTLRLRPMAIIQGAVRDENGEPMPGVNVTPVRKIIQQGRASLQVAGSVTTDDLGEYRVANLEGGRYLLCWTAPASAYQLHKGVAYPMGCFPGGVPASEAKWMDLAAGQALIADFAVSPVQASRISGTLDGAAGRQVSILVMRRDPDGLPLPAPGSTRWDDKTSSFQVLGLPPGKFRITAEVSRQGGNPRAVYDFDATGQNVSGIRLTAADPVPLTGVLRFTGDSPPAGNSVGVNLSGDGYYSVMASADNVFSIPDIQPGKYELKLQTPQHWFIKSATQDGNDVLENGIHIEAGAAPSPLDIELAEGGGSLEVSVPGEASALITVLRRTASGIRLESETYLGGNSRSNPPHRVEEFPPGDYVVFAWGSGANVEYLNPDVLREYDGFGQTVTVREGSTARVVLRLAPVAAGN